MEESLKNRIILILLIVSIIFFIGTIGSCNSSYRLKSAYNREMSTRLDLEEKISKLTQDKKVMEIKLQNANQALQDEKTAHEAARNSLEQEQLANQALKEELARMAKLKETLEQDLKEALGAEKSKSKK